MWFLDFLHSIGVEPKVAAGGLAGGLLRGLSRRNINLAERIVSPICGMLAAVYLTAPALHYLRAVGWPLPDDPVASLTGAAFVVGTSGMWISDFFWMLAARWLKIGKAA